MFNFFKKTIKEHTVCDSKDFKTLLKIKNTNLNTILNYANDNPIFFGENKRLLSKDEIENFEEQCECKIYKYIPLIDVFDKNFIVYDEENDIFGLYNIVDETLFTKNVNIEQIISEIKIYFNNEGNDMNV